MTDTEGSVILLDTRNADNLHSSSMRLTRGSSWVLVGIAVVMVLGHICALPFHAHAGAITTHEEDQSHHGDEHPDEDAVHAASCDAAKSGPSWVDGAGLVLLGPVVTSASVLRRHVPEGDPAVVLGGPPLFLLHATLLI
jgi:hypothetical protein